MHPYLPHLLSDIAAAHRLEIPEEESTQTIEEHFEAVEKWIKGAEPTHTFGYYCGLTSEDFPPANQLTEKDMKIIRTAFEKMMFTWNVDISLPDKLPADFAYKMIVNTLKEKIDIVMSGVMGFDYCTGYAPDCIFKEYCPCLEIWNKSDNADDEMNMDSSEEDQPY